MDRERVEGSVVVRIVNVNLNSSLDLDMRDRMVMGIYSASVIFHIPYFILVKYYNNNNNISLSFGQRIIRNKRSLSTVSPYSLILSISGVIR